MDARFSRTKLLIGDIGVERLQAAHVFICGLGAVGGYCLEGLARAGVGKFTLVDFDTVHPSNINRQLLALDSTAGELKVDIAEKRVRDINPSCIVEKGGFFLDESFLASWEALAQATCVVDAIDSLSSKVSLLANCESRGVKIFSSMGAALRRDPLQIQVGLLSEVAGCPLASKVKKHLRNRGAATSVPCVYSSEKVVKGKALADREHLGEPKAADRGRERKVMGSLSTITGIFGLVLADMVIDYIVDS